MSVKLTDAQLVMMSAAAQRKDCCLSAPSTIKGAALSKVSAKLAKLGLAREIEAKPGAPIWSRDDAGQGYALKLTAAGLKAIAVDEGSPARNERHPSSEDGADEYDRTHGTGQVHREPGFLQHARDLCRYEKLNSPVCHQSDNDNRAHYPAGPQGTMQGHRSIGLPV
jgi:hypothetical protein